jgi:hypothetical protein
MEVEDLLRKFTFHRIRCESFTTYNAHTWEPITD